MNYILKLHPSSGFLVESLGINTKFSRDNYICAHCLHRHGVIRNNARELSTYVSALKLMLKRKEILKKAEKVEKVENKEHFKSSSKLKWLNKKSHTYITELLKVTSSKSLSTKMKIQQIRPSEVTAFAEQPGMTFVKCKFGATKPENSKVLEHPPSGVNLNDADICATVKPKLLLPNSEGKALSSKLISKNDINNYLSGNLVNESKLKLHDVAIKTDTKPAKRSTAKSTKLNKRNEVTNETAIKVLPLSKTEIMTASTKPNTSKKLSELKQLVMPKTEKLVNDLASPETEVKVDLEIINFLKKNVSPVVPEESDINQVSYLKERTLQPFSFSFTQQYAFSLFLHSYIDVCIVNNNLNEALLMFYNSRYSQTWKSLLKRNKNLVSIYNTLLKAYSEKGNWNVTTIIINWMKQDEVKLNSESFAHILCCLHNAGAENFPNANFEKTEIINVIHKLMSNNISLNDIFAKTKLSKETTEKILTLFRKVLPSFEIEPTTIKLNSDCHLLKNLYAGQNALQSPLNNTFSNETMEKLVEEQLMMEKKFFVKIAAVYKGNCTEKQKEEIEVLKADWRKQLRKGFLTKFKFVKESEAADKYNIYMYLNTLPVQMFVNIMMQIVEELVEYSGGYSPGASTFHKILGEMVNQCYNIRKKIISGDLKKTEDLYKKYTSWYLDPCGPARNTRQEWQMLSQDSNGRCLLETTVIRWPTEVIHKVGKTLYEIIINELMFTPVKEGLLEKPIPVFYPVLRKNSEKSSEEVKCHPIVAKLFREVGFTNLTFPADRVPMVCPPKPWKAADHGGYLLLNSDLIRPSQHLSGKNINYSRVPVQQMYATFDALNALQAVPWIINENVLDVALEVFENGGSDKLDVPGLPESTPVQSKVTPGMSASERFQEYKNKEKINMEKRNKYGLWCEALYKLSLANHFRKRVFWLPQNCDFRGRVYPVPPHLNHLGADLFRSLLVFAKGKPLGPKGLDWLKIHTINLTGALKKRPVEERLKHANDVLPDILDSAENPLTGRKWWTESEEPWQTLAACMEIKKALESPNPELYVSRFPVHQDGSCNGLQHYAALGRDVIGAKSVNLAPCDAPQDVYSVVAEIVEQKRAEDAKTGESVAQVLDGFIERKVVKQTVMTTVYGVTKYGAKLQIAKRLEEIESFSQGNVKKASEYLSEKTFQSLNQMFCSAKEIQDWFIKCADEICKRKEYVQWTSPLGLPILQSYARRSHNSKTKTTVTIPDAMKQKNAFPPNFVHSLDSSHMMLTALFCEQAGITFAAIHDCFWTHPADVDALNIICREQFISLHSQEILRDLSDFFKKCYIKSQSSPEDKHAAEIFDSVPKTGDFSLDKVLNSVYFFS